VSYIAVIDYEIGNIRSILNALEKLGVPAKLTRDEGEIMSSSGVILPGVGAFNHGMSKLDEHGLVGVLSEYAVSGKPLMGICLGMQMLFESSKEFGDTKGLGFVSGHVVELETFNERYEKLPHVSWNELSEPSLGRWKGSILEDIEPQTDMYFVHSFIVKPTEASNILSTTTYSGNEFCSAVKKGSIYGCQFHPEKSATEGLNIIKKFVELCKVLIK
jgi:glutamine amidotransferase